MLRSEDYGFAKREENTGVMSEQMGPEAMPEISGNRELSDAEIQERSENIPLQEESAISPAQDQNYRNYIVRYSQNIMVPQIMNQTGPFRSSTSGSGLFIRLQSGRRRRSLTAIHTPPFRNAIHTWIWEVFLRPDQPAP